MPEGRFCEEFWRGWGWLGLDFGFVMIEVVVRGLGVVETDWEVVVGGCRDAGSVGFTTSGFTGGGVSRGSGFFTYPSFDPDGWGILFGSLVRCTCLLSPVLYQIHIDIDNLPLNPNPPPLSRLCSRSSTRRFLNS